MLVPDHSQLVAGSGGDRCGETCLVSCLTAIKAPSLPSVRDVCNYLHVDYNNAMSTLYQLLDAAHHYGAHAQLLNNEIAVNTEEQDHPNHAIIILLYNAFLDPLPYPHAPGWYGNHFIVLEKINPLKHTCLLMDPLAYPGPNQVEVTYASFVKAVHAVPILPWGISLWLDAPSKHTIKSGPKV